MDEITAWLNAAWESVLRSLTAVADQLPALGGAVLILIAGWVVARLAGRVVRRVAEGAQSLTHRLFPSGVQSGVRISRAAITVLGEAVFWIVLFLAVTLAARVAGLTGFAAWLDQIAALLPDLIVGVAIILAGYVLSLVLGEQVTEAARAAQAGQSVLMGKLTQSAVIATALIMGLAHIGIDVTFLIAVFAVAVGAIFVGFSIAFGLGAKDHVGNLIGARTARRALTPGHHVRIGEIEGQILEVTATQIALETESGRTLIPARWAEMETIVFPTRTEREESDE